MTETELKYFLSTILRYFEQVTGEAAVMGLPYVKKEEAVVMDYTGLIGISGPRRGGIYFTAGRGLLEALTRAILGLEGADDETLLDMVGEVTNTIAGNVREHFGQDFMISVPMLIRGKPLDILMKLKPPLFILPLFWRKERAYLVVGLE